jgi:hypothetical protein
MARPKQAPPHHWVIVVVVVGLFGSGSRCWMSATPAWASTRAGKVQHGPPRSAPPLSFSSPCPTVSSAASSVALLGCGQGVNGTQHYADGTPVINTARFPDMKALVDYGHSRGVRMGWYLNGCACGEKRALDINYEVVAGRLGRGSNCGPLPLLLTWRTGAGGHCFPSCAGVRRGQV